MAGRHLRKPTNGNGQRNGENYIGTAQSSERMSAYLRRKKTSCKQRPPWHAIAQDSFESIRSAQRVQTLALNHLEPHGTGRVSHRRVKVTHSAPKANQESRVRNVTAWAGQKYVTPRDKRPGKNETLHNTCLQTCAEKLHAAA